MSSAEREGEGAWGGSARLIAAVSGAGIALALAGAVGLGSPAGSGHTGTGCQLGPRDVGTFVEIPGGGFVQGAAPLYAEEGPPRRVFVSPFRLQTHEVTNDQFAAFVAATGYVTEAERGGGSARFSPRAAVQGSWWTLDRSASWRTPEGAGSSLTGRGLHPVVHVTLGDARAYAAWAGGRLPTEVEWEYAASLGRLEPANAQDPESERRGPDGAPRANTWTGEFPHRDTADDGFAGTAPVGCFPASRLGLYDLIGNVWEWTDTPFRRGEPRFTIKGGSYLCAPDHCRRYRAAARQGVEPDFSTSHVGFRIIKDLERP